MEYQTRLCSLNTRPSGNAIETEFESKSEETKVERKSETCQLLGKDFFS